MLLPWPGQAPGNAVALFGFAVGRSQRIYPGVAEDQAPADLGAQLVELPGAVAHNCSRFVAGPAAEAAAIYFPFHLSWLGLFERGGLTAGETVLIHAAAGGVGSAAVQLAKNAGATVIATAGSTHKLELCRELGADVAIDYRADDFAPIALDATNGRGVDVVFDSVGGEVTERSMTCMGFNARLLAVGFAGGIEAEDDSRLTPRPWLFGNFSFCGVCHAYVDDPIAFKRDTGLNFPSHADGEALHKRVLDLLAKGAVRPVIGQRLDFDGLPRAFDAIARREAVGRSILVL